jgi:hypothetical protein
MRRYKIPHVREKREREERETTSGKRRFAREGRSAFTERALSSKVRLTTTKRTERERG